MVKLRRKWQNQFDLKMTMFLIELESCQLDYPTERLILIAWGGGGGINQLPCSITWCHSRESIIIKWSKKPFSFYSPVLLPKVNKTAKLLPIVTMGNCAILIMVLMVVFVNRAQEKRTKLASIQDTTPTLEPLNAKMFVLSSNKVS